MPLPTTATNTTSTTSTSTSTNTTNNATSLYGAPRPKNKPIKLSSTSIHALSTELSLARAKLAKTDKSAPARPRQRPLSNGSKSLLFQPHNKGVSARAAKDLASPDPAAGAAAGGGGGGGGVGEREWQHSRQALKAKARVYEQLRRGEADDDSEGALVDFDRKWAENGDSPDDDDDDDDDADADEDEEMVEYEDEFGRTRTGPRSLAARETKRREAAAAGGGGGGGGGGATGGGSFAPPGVIYGNVIQTHAFQSAAFASLPDKADLASTVPTPASAEAHYDARSEVRTKGVGFYQFSTDNATREAEMAALERERLRTETERREKAERRQRRRTEVEQRREAVRAKRRGKVGSAWLEQQFGSL